MTSRRGFFGMLAAAVAAVLAPKLAPVDHSIDFRSVSIGQWADYCNEQWNCGDGYINTWGHLPVDGKLRFKLFRDGRLSVLPPVEAQMPIRIVMDNGAYLDAADWGWMKNMVLDPQIAPTFEASGHADHLKALLRAALPEAA